MKTGRGAAVVVAAAVGALLAQGRASAELLEVRQIAAGMECPECARGLRLLVKEIAGVDDAETSWNRRVLSVRFHPGSGATLAQVRAAVSHQHFEPREAEVVIAGQLTLAPAARSAGSQSVAAAATLWVPESGLTYRIDLLGREAAWRRTWAEMSGGEVVITGRVPRGDRAEDPLVLYPIDIQRADPRHPPGPPPALSNPR
jgi:hypothetical protein